MAWQAKPRYTNSSTRQGYYVQLAGKKICLAHGKLCAKCEKREKEGEIANCPACKPIRLQADTRFAEIQHLDNIGKSEDSATVFALCNKYLDYVKETKKPRTFQNSHYILSLFSGEYQEKIVRQLKPFHIDEWLNKMGTVRTVQTPQGERKRKWGKSSKGMAINVLNAMFNWGIKKEYISKNPIIGAQRYGRVSRSEDALISPAEQAAIIAELRIKYSPRWYASKESYYVCLRNKQIFLAKGQEGGETLERAKAVLESIRLEEMLFSEFEILLRVFAHTGARMGEIYNATAQDWHETETESFFLYKKADPQKEGFSHKNATKGKDRVIFVCCPELRAIIRTLISKYPSGPIFRNLIGTKWTDFSVQTRLKSLVHKLGLNPAIMPYSYRHTSITDMLLNKGIDIVCVADLHGTSVEMISKHYSHINAKSHRSTMASIFASARS